MRRFLLSFFLLGAMLTNAQVGINTEDPRALLDIKAANEVVSTNTPGVMVVGDGLLIPRVSSLLVDTDFPIEGVIVYLTSSFTDTAPDPDVIYEPGFYISYNSSWETIGANGGSAGLEEITEGGNTGYRRADADPANHGNIGEDAVDVSTSLRISSTDGATGTWSTAFGLETTASSLGSTALGYRTVSAGEASTSMGIFTNAAGPYSVAMGFGTTTLAAQATSMGTFTTAKSINEVAMGSYNTDYTVENDDTDRLFVLGNGINNSNRSDALIVRKNGIITAPSLDLAEIVDNKALITKEYFDAGNSSDAGLEEVTENSNTGFRRANIDAANYGNIGDEAVDLSFNSSTSTTAGATGSSSVASGASTTASGMISTASGNFAMTTGWETSATNLGTTAMGSFTTASAPYSTAMGYGTTALTQYETALGVFNILDSQNDNLLVVGNGLADGFRSDAFLITKDGVVTAPSFDLNKFNNAGGKALITKEYFDANNTGSSGTAPGLVRITESLSTGYRLAAANSANHGSIGNNAVDLSYSNSSSSINGATGSESFAVGSSTVASGTTSIAMGDRTTASNTISTAMGSNTTASGSVSTAIGNSTIASGINSTAMGWQTIAASPSETAIGTYNIENASDNLFVVGNGSPAGRSDAFLVRNGGTITAPSFDISEITAAGNKALITKEYLEDTTIVRLPNGDTAGRPTGNNAPAFGTMRYNTETGRPEIYVENSTNLNTSQSASYVPGWITL